MWHLRRRVIVDPKATASTVVGLSPITIYVNAYVCMYVCVYEGEAENIFAARKGRESKEVAKVK